jgi:hypothetical protein
MRKNTKQAPRIPWLESRPAQHRDAGWHALCCVQGFSPVCKVAIPGMKGCLTPLLIINYALEENKGKADTKQHLM